MRCGEKRVVWERVFEKKRERGEIPETGYDTGTPEPIRIDMDGTYPEEVSDDTAPAQSANTDRKVLDVLAKQYGLEVDDADVLDPEHYELYADTFEYLEEPRRDTAVRIYVANHDTLAAEQKSTKKRLMEGGKTWETILDGFDGFVGNQDGNTVSYRTP